MCDWPVPFDTRKICAEVLWLNGTDCVEPVLPMPPGSPRLSEPELSAMFELPVTALVSERPLQPARSLLRFMSPSRDVAMSSR